MSNPFQNLPPTPASHFRLYFYAAILHLIEHITQLYDSYEKVYEQFPFLVGYNNELAENGLEGLKQGEAGIRWMDDIFEWEDKVSGHLPLCALRESAGLDHESLTLLIIIGLIEEDIRFVHLFETIHGIAGQSRPTLGLLQGIGEDLPVDVNQLIRQLQRLGLLNINNNDTPRSQWGLNIPVLIWDAMKGDLPAEPASCFRFTPPQHLINLYDLLLPEEIRSYINRIPSLVKSGEVQTLIIRGLRHNGRKSILGSIAKVLGQGIIKIKGLDKDDELWRMVGTLATLLNAMPVIELEQSPGDVIELPQIEGYDGLTGVASGKYGGVRVGNTDSMITLSIGIPDSDIRRLLWERSFGSIQVKDPESTIDQIRMTSGNIYRTASLAKLYAGLSDRNVVSNEDIRKASYDLNRQYLDSLAVHIPASGDWEDLAVNSEVLKELHNLENRCRFREQLHRFAGGTPGSRLNTGVRALFSGPSGTGKTLAATLLSSVLNKDIYRIDLATVVNKYIGETEKNLNKIFTLAEELDIILLLDEGDSLLTHRTSVQTSNDRYANLETNYLLQRIESYEGILIITTNAFDYIDTAFQRRIDVFVNFTPPEIEERWVLWKMHLPKIHKIDEQFLAEVSQRCVFTGGQIRNIVLHASLKALRNNGLITGDYLTEAIQREYRKTGGVCPLQKVTAA